MNFRLAKKMQLQLPNRHIAANETLVPLEERPRIVSPIDVKEFSAHAASSHGRNSSVLEKHASAVTARVGPSGLDRPNTDRNSSVHNDYEARSQESISPPHQKKAKSPF